MGKRKNKKPRVEVLDWERLLIVEKTVEELIAQHHPHLARAKVIVVGKPKARKSGDRIIIATSKAVGPEMAATLKDQEIGECHYLIILGRDAWNALAQDEKRIQVDRALCAFAGQDEKGRWTLNGYDIQDYRRMVDWYGLYSSDVQLYGKVVGEQLELAEGKA